MKKRTKLILILCLMCVASSTYANFFGGNDAVVSKALDFINTEAKSVLNWVTMGTRVIGGLGVMGAFIVAGRSIAMAAVLMFVSIGVIASPKLGTDMAQAFKSEGFSKLMDN